MEPRYAEHDWRSLVDLHTPELIIALTDVHAALANLIEDIAFMRADRIRHGEKGVNDEIVMAECRRDVLIEKKFLLARLLDVRLKG